MFIINYISKFDRITNITNKINYGYRKSIREQIKEIAKIYSLYEKIQC